MYQNHYQNRYQEQHCNQSYCGPKINISVNVDLMCGCCCMDCHNRYRYCEVNEYQQRSIPQTSRDVDQSSYIKMMDVINQLKQKQQSREVDPSTYNKMMDVINQLKQKQQSRPRGFNHIEPVQMQPEVYMPTRQELLTIIEEIMGYLPESSDGGSNQYNPHGPPHK